MDGRVLLVEDDASIREVTASVCAGPASGSAPRAAPRLIRTVRGVGYQLSTG